MILALLAAASVSAQAPAVTAPDPAIIEDAAHAIDRGRLREAKLLIVRAITGGARGPSVDRLNANFAFASGHYVEALSAYQRLAGSAEKRQVDCEQGAHRGVEARQVRRREAAGRLRGGGQRRILARLEFARVSLPMRRATGRRQTRLFRGRGRWLRARPASSTIRAGPSSSAAIGQAPSPCWSRPPHSIQSRSASPIISSSRTRRLQPTFLSGVPEKAIATGPFASTTPGWPPSCSATGSARLRRSPRRSKRAQCGTAGPRTTSSC